MRVNNLLEEAIDSTAPSSSVCKLKDLCRTRWIERIDAVQRFKDLQDKGRSMIECTRCRGWSHTGGHSDHKCYRPTSPRPIFHMSSQSQKGN